MFRQGRTGMPRAIQGPESCQNTDVTQTKHCENKAIETSVLHRRLRYLLDPANRNVVSYTLKNLTRDKRKEKNGKSGKEKKRK
jgi:hypothetical protein